MSPPHLALRLFARHARGLTRLMQALLVTLAGYGLLIGAPRTVTNASIGFLVTLLPALLRANARVVLAPGLTLWITAAVFLHALGTSGLYHQVGWWDHLTHVLSASLVAATGYVAVRVFDLHSERIDLPHRVLTVYVVIFTVALGVIWELFEFALDELGRRTHLTMPLAQYGLEDTITDLTFNALGALAVGILGHLYLSAFADRLRRRLLD